MDADQVESFENGEAAGRRERPAHHAANEPAGTRHAGRAPRTRPRLSDEPGLTLAAASLVLLGAFGLALWTGWPGLLFVIAMLQVFLARSWVGYLDVPGALAVSVGVVAVAATADVGVVVARLADGSTRRADDLVQLAPALGVVFLVAVLAQLARRDGRAGALAGLVAATTGGVLVVAMALWLPLQASHAGAAPVAFGAGVVATVGVMVGLGAWVRRTDAPGPALLLPVLVALLAGPFYVLARLIAG